MEVAACLIPIEVALVHRSLFPSQHAPIPLIPTITLGIRF